VVELIADRGSMLELEPAFGRPIVTALARLGGESVAVVANQPAAKAGAIDSEAADKAAHFIDVADAFHLPLVFLADNPGVLARACTRGAPAARLAARRPRGGGAAAGVDDGGRGALDHAGLGGAYPSAAARRSEGVIDPRGLRNALLAALRLASGRRSVPPEP